MLRRILLIIFTTLIYGCSTSSPPEFVPPESDILWRYAHNGIVLQLQADEELNWHKGSPSSLALCLHLLASRVPVADFMNSKEGIDALLHCEPDEPSILSSQRLFMNPGQTATFFFDREEKTRFAVLVGGYHDGTPSGMAVLQKVPVPALRTKGWLTRIFSSDTPEWREPEQLVITLYLGPVGMLKRPAYKDKK